MLRALRVVGLVEGTSFLVLLLVAMPLRYIGGEREPVRIVGAIHGGLFLLYVAVGVIVAWRRRWSIKRLLALAFASALPLGTFVFDAALRREEAAEAK